MSVILASMLTFSHSILKWVSMNSDGNLITTVLEYWYMIGGAIILYLVIFFLYMFLLQTHDISRLYPAYTGMSIILVPVVGVIFFNEIMTLPQIIGCVSIVFGIILINHSTV